MTALSIFSRSAQDLGAEDKQTSSESTEIHWVGYDELAELTGLERESLIQIARRQGWLRRPGRSKGAVQFAVPSDLLEECRVARAGGNQAAIPWGRLAADPATDVKIVLGSICRKFHDLERREDRLEGYLRQQLERECRRADRAECAAAGSQGQLATALREMETLQAAVVLERAASDSTLRDATQRILLLNGALDAERAQAVLAAEAIAAARRELVAEQDRFEAALADERSCATVATLSVAAAADAIAGAAALEIAAGRAALAQADQHSSLLQAMADEEMALLRAMLAEAHMASEQARRSVAEVTAERERLEASWDRERDAASSQLQEVVSAAEMARVLFGEDRLKADSALAEAVDTVRTLEAKLADCEQRAEDAACRAEASACARVAAAVAEERERTSAAIATATTAETRGDRLAGQLQLEKVRANEAEARLAKLDQETSKRARTPSGMFAQFARNWLGHVRRTLLITR